MPLTSRSNPVLAAYRAAEGRSPDEWLLALEAWDAFGGFTRWEDPEHPFHAFTLASDEQIGAARPVLERLAIVAMLAESSEVGAVSTLGVVRGSAWLVGAAAIGGLWVSPDGPLSVLLFAIIVGAFLTLLCTFIPRDGEADR
jgi:hypothetical protein